MGQAGFCSSRRMALRAMGLAPLAWCGPGWSSTSTDWSAVLRQARGQTVQFHAWAGSEAINAYIAWIAEQVEQRYDVRLRHVRVSDAAEVVRRIQVEVAAGRDAGGAVDLVWINGENFRALKQESLLAAPWADALPNAALLDERLPLRYDFSTPVEGQSSPWGTAQLNLLTDQRRVAEAPRSLPELGEFIRQRPGRFTYPRPPQFHGTSWLKQVLLSTLGPIDELQHPAGPTATASLQALWDWLDAHHPLMWREGQEFPSSQADLHRMLANGEIDFSISFNPNEAANLVAQGEVPPTVYSFGFADGMLGNAHFVAIPRNSASKEAAQVVANFLLSPEAQARKADVSIWGDPSVLHPDRVPQDLRGALFERPMPSLPASVPMLAEPHASWVAVLEAEWTQRYGVRRS